MWCLRIRCFAGVLQHTIIVSKALCMKMVLSSPTAKPSVRKLSKVKTDNCTLQHAVMQYHLPHVKRSSQGLLAARGGKGLTTPLWEVVGGCLLQQGCATHGHFAL